MPQTSKLRETEDGTILFNVPFPTELGDVKGMAPIVIKDPYQVDNIHSFGQDSPFFAGLANKKLLGRRCACNYTYGTPRLYCMDCGGDDVHDFA